MIGKSDLLGLVAADDNFQPPALRAHQRSRLSWENITTACDRVTTAVHTALDKSAPDTDPGRNEENECRRKSVEWTIASVAGSSVSESAAEIASQRSVRVDFEIVYVVANLKQLKAMCTDEKYLKFMMRYLD